MAGDPCPNCGLVFSPHLDRCEHCDWDVGAPNVRLARHPDEVAALRERLAQARDDADRRGCLAAVDRFAAAVAQSRAVICKSRDQLHGMVASGEGSWMIPTYHDQVRGHARPPGTPEWDWLRAQERRWFPFHTERMHYGALSLDQSGIAAWGEVALVLAERQIGRRTSVGEDNAVLLGKRTPMDQPLPRGCRAPWEQRGDLCVAKLYARIEPDTPAEAFQGILMSDVGERGQAAFVEVHLYGSLTLDGVARVRVSRQHEAKSSELWEKLRARGIEVEFLDEAAP